MSDTNELQTKVPTYTGRPALGQPVAMVTGTEGSVGGVLTMM